MIDDSWYLRVGKWVNGNLAVDEVVSAKGYQVLVPNVMSFHELG
jgi:hypothetical protein